MYVGVVTHLGRVLLLSKMDLAKVSSDEKVKICKKYFIIGCFALPFVWFVNILWFFKDSFIIRTPPPPPKMRAYVFFSFIGLVVWVAIAVLWTSIYQTQRTKWGAAGVFISFVLPAGKP